MVVTGNDCANNLDSGRNGVGTTPIKVGAQYHMLFKDGILASQRDNIPRSRGFALQRHK